MQEHWHFDESDGSAARPTVTMEQKGTDTPVSTMLEYIQVPRGTGECIGSIHSSPNKIRIENSHFHAIKGRE